MGGMVACLQGRYPEFHLLMHSTPLALVLTSLG